MTSRAFGRGRRSLVAPRPSASGSRAFGIRRGNLVAPRTSTSVGELGSASAFGLGPSGLRLSAWTSRKSEVFLADLRQSLAYCVVPPDERELAESVDR